MQTELLRLSRVNFSESFQVFVHLKVLRLFVESVLRYGLPAQYTGIVVKVKSFIISCSSLNSSCCSLNPKRLRRFSIHSKPNSLTSDRSQIVRIRSRGRRILILSVNTNRCSIRSTTILSCLKSLGSSSE